MKSGLMKLTSVAMLLFSSFSVSSNSVNAYTTIGGKYGVSTIHNIYI